MWKERADSPDFTALRDEFDERDTLAAEQ
jgi:hypothetical protein